MPTPPPRADVTVCIPAWQAEGFIDRTLECARAQSHPSLRILVSVDQCDDGTAAICQRHASEDPRVQVVLQPKRLGWADNTNALLNRVETEFFCLYFHDDIIKPEYVARLYALLMNNPDAVAAYCDVRLFGNATGTITGTPYTGQPVDRLLKVMGPQRGAPLRALTRSRLLAEGLRFPDVAGQGFWRWYPYLIDLIAAGPLVHLPEALYERWIRADGLTTTWQMQTVDDLLLGQRDSIESCLRRFDTLAATPREIGLLRYSFYLFTMAWTRRIELNFPAGHRPLDPAALSPAFVGIAVPKEGELAHADFRAWITLAEAELRSLEEKLSSRQETP